MGTTYQPRNKKLGKFMVNSAGRDVLGALHENLGIAVSPDLTRERYISQYPEMFEGVPRHVPYRAKKQFARKMGEQLSSCSDETILAAKLSWGWGGTNEGFVSWAREWQDFLIKGRGYTSY